MPCLPGSHDCATPGGNFVVRFRVMRMLAVGIIMAMDVTILMGCAFALHGHVAVLMGVARLLGLGHGHHAQAIPVNQFAAAPGGGQQ